MDNKKILLVGLVLVAAASLGFAVQLNFANKNLTTQFSAKEQEFQQEKQSLSQQLASLLESKKRLDAELGDLRLKFDILTQEREGLNNKFEQAVKERSELEQRLEGLAQEKEALELEVVELKKTGALALVHEPSAPTTPPPSSEDAYWAGLLRDKAALEVQVTNLSAQLSDAQLKLEKAMEEGRKLDLQFKTVAAAKGDLERRLGYNERLSQTLSEDLLREKRDKKAIGEQIEGLRQENFELKSRLMSLGDKKTSLETKLVDLQQEREVLGRRLSELDQILQDRVDQMIQVKDDLKAARSETKDITPQESRVVQLQPIVVKAAEEPAPPKQTAARAGSVLAINEENNFVIIDMGEDDGVKAAENYTIYRNNQKIAVVEVIQTRKEISAADIKKVFAGAKIKIGDIVS